MSIFVLIVVFLYELGRMVVDVIGMFILLFLVFRWLLNQTISELVYLAEEGKNQ